MAYVSSSKKDSESEIDVEAELTGEVDLKFKSETFPLERFADAGAIGSIQGNTAVPAANKPITGNTAGDAPSPFLAISGHVWTAPCWQGLN